MTDKEKDKRPYFVLTNEYPRHRKIRHLSDKAFRLHVTLLGLCNEDRNDGIISKQDLQMLGPSAGKELLSKSLVHEKEPGIYQLHDYLRHQNSRQEIEELVTEKQAAGKIGGMKSAHKRWHVDRGIHDPNCELCVAETG
ncbi:hypothetical protein BV113_00190 [Glutamicibacter phage BIM BV-113]|nr:hypothetical protein BV113_00190 [Glutamicibacter phage BIM BV-113]